MTDKVVFNEDSIPSVSVDWGRTKELVGKFCKARSEHILVKITEYLPGYIHSMHVHAIQEEMIFVLSGHGYTETEQGKEKLVPGCVSFIPAGVKHATCNPNDETLRVLIVKSPPDNSSIYADSAEPQNT